MNARLSRFLAYTQPAIPANPATLVSDIDKNSENSSSNESESAGWAGRDLELIDWFHRKLNRLPAKPFTLEYWPNGEAMVIVGVPAAYYRELGAAIEEGPAGSKSHQLISILFQLRARFAEMEGNDETEN